MRPEQSFLKRQTELSAAKQALLEKRLKQLAGKPEQLVQHSPRSQTDLLPLSFAQQRMWFLQQLEPESAAYNEALATRLRGPFDLQAFDRTARTLLERHEVLRCYFPLVDGKVVQVIDNDIQHHYTVPFEDFRALSPAEQISEIKRRSQLEMLRPFDLTSELPFRSWIWQLGEQEYYSLTIMHHIITDGWSFSLFLHEIGQLYDAYAAGRPNPLPRLKLRYSDYAAQQRQWVESSDAEKQLRYWQQRLGGQLPLLNLPLDRLHPEMPGYQGERVKFTIPQHLSRELQTLSHKTSTTLFMTLLTAWLIVLSRYCQQDDLLVGTPTAGRTYPELEEIMGFFVNTLVLRNDLAGNPTVQELLSRVRKATLEAYDHQEVPFEKLVELLQPERSLNHNPLFQVMFILQNTPPTTMAFGDLTYESVELHNDTTKFDLELALQETDHGLNGYIEFSKDVFDTSTIERLHKHYVQILQSMVADPLQRIADLPLLSEDERTLVLETWNHRQDQPIAPGSFIEDFQRQVARTPLAVAVRDEHKKLTYQELDAQSTRLAAHLQLQGIQPEQIVGLYCQRSVLWAVAVLALFKVGGVYLPLDPQHPPARLLSMLQQSQCTLLLSSQDLTAQLRNALGESGASPIQVFALETLLATEPTTEPRPWNYPSEAQLAYVIFTSGSTGQPKGAMVEHRGMRNHLFAKIAALELHEHDIVAQTASQSFDISVWQLLAPWLVGAQARIYPEWLVADLQTILPRFQQDHVTILEGVPSWLRALIDVQAQNGAPGGVHMRWVIPTGEALPTDLCRRWFESGTNIPLLNAYGPTECSDDITHQEIRSLADIETWGTIAPIGRAVPNLHLYVLDAQQQPQPIGVSGEIYAGGVGVGRGYIGNPQRTAEAFVPHPWSIQPGERLYRTGDVGRYRADGSLEFLGRIDQQVKLRGYRIELGEIEQALRQQVGIRESVVTIKTSEQGHARLVGYVVLDEGQPFSLELTQKAIREQLPEYMVPGTIIPLQALPTMTSGKIDLQALPEPEGSESDLHEDYVAPRTALEEQLTAIWIDVLNLKSVGVYHNFFAVGGHSLLITQILVRVQENLQVTLPVRTMFKNPTIAGLAEAIEHMQSRTNELRKQSVSSVSREAYRQKRSALIEVGDNGNNQ
jgi:amino acid adenylation domain-containing protein